MARTGRETFWEKRHPTCTGTYPGAVAWSKEKGLTFLYGNAAEGSGGMDEV